MNNIKLLRVNLDKTQEEVAKELNMPRTKYARYELGTAEPNINTLKQLATYYHVTIDNLVGHETPYLIDKSQFTQTQLNIIEQIKTLQEEACQKIEAYIIGLKSAEEEKQRIINLYKNNK